MNKYEGMFLLDHGKVKNEPQKGIDEVAQVLEKHGAKIAQIGKWDERKLAYEIKRQKRGTYVLVHFDADPQALDELRRDLSLNETINRHLLLRIEGAEFPPFMTAQELDTAYGTREFRERPMGGRRDRDERDRRPRGRRDDDDNDDVSPDMDDEGDDN
ncbi:MAG: 30S ribosomal protein S6 [Planctomycetes bacterium]|nr:30S ribosomal protein S6 [Planctomycetota bacterium]